ncbi:MAG: YjbQ family protein [Deltaproteobacteria bacterium]|nr:YjbQ family protein [Deltaproteobacteria bacterium]
MPARYAELVFETTEPLQIIDISTQVQWVFQESNGGDCDLLHLASLHTTCALIINERCEHLQKDMLDFLQRLTPPQVSEYRHDKIAIDGRPNTHSHLLGMLLPSSQTLVIKKREIQLGIWQSIFLVELDGPRKERKIQLSFFQN